MVNITMAAWVHETNGRRLDRGVVVSVGNASMCVATTVVIVACRLRCAAKEWLEAPTDDDGPIHACDDGAVASLPAASPDTLSCGRF
jgi:hypothetical protein